MRGRGGSCCRCLGAKPGPAKPGPGGLAAGLLGRMAAERASPPGRRRHAPQKNQGAASLSEIRKQECPAGTAKHRIVAQSCQIQGGGSHALLCGMQEPPTQKMAALSQIMRACFLIEEGFTWRPDCFFPGYFTRALSLRRRRAPIRSRRRQQASQNRNVSCPRPRLRRLSGAACRE